MCCGAVGGDEQRRTEAVGTGGGQERVWVALGLWRGTAIGERCRVERECRDERTIRRGKSTGEEKNSEPALMGKEKRKKRTQGRGRMCQEDGQTLGIGKD